ncbi:Uncharacterized conserved protein UCP015417 [Abeliophyllum distichum]|uniref:Uncharacterized conserved protein UCP015417 n=1 Tax=Abeliophyllum distichum TaxID=126358 RepID=A0ABD1Q0J7_9LAMI
MFPKESHSEYEGIEEAHYVYRVRDRVRKEVLVPLHKALELPEVFMSANEWNVLPYNRVASVAMKNYKELFLTHDSESMSGIPMEVSVALGVLVSELSEDPWKGKLITFSANPELQEVKGDTLKAKTEFVRNMDWGMNTNFQKAFDRILDVAVEGKLSEEQMIKRVFVFSDMEFDQASEKPWETDYQAVQRKFREKGYQNVPEIVFWNLRDSRATPVMANQSGVALVSGFSKNLLTMFLEGGGIVNPEEVMELAISGEEYKKLVVFD